MYAFTLLSMALQHIEQATLHLPNVGFVRNAQKI